MNIIKSYNDNGFNVGGTVFNGAIIVTIDDVLPFTCNEFELSNFINDDMRALAGKIDVLLIGAGRNFSFITPKQRALFLGLGFGVDVMDTPAACRTYNVLLTEGRRIAAALVPIK